MLHRAAPLGFVLLLVANGVLAQDDAALELEVRSETHLRGSYTVGKLTLFFDSRRTDKVVEAALWSNDRMFLQVTSDGVMFKLNLFDDLRVEGEVPHGDGDPDVKVAGDVGAMHRLGRAAEFLLLPNLSDALDARDIIGSKSPASIYLHALAVHVAALPPAGRVEPAARRVILRCHEGTHTGQCRDLRDQHDNDCLGMCGRGKCCWRRICGDCCGYRGCYIHDLTCSKCGCVGRADMCLLCGTAISFVSLRPCAPLPYEQRERPRCP